MSSDFPPLRSLSERAANLPLAPTTFVGRARERTSVEKLLTMHRVVTLTGPGGVGKTRLALQVATDMLAAFDDGVWFVPLAGVSDPGLVPSTIAQVLGLSERGGAAIVETLREHVRSREMLLVVDNAEHLVQSAAAALMELSAAGPKVKLLVTSRVPLHLAAEQLFPVPPLVASAGSDAVDLFVQRAIAVHPLLSLDDDARDDQILCARVMAFPRDRLAASRSRCSRRARSLPV